MRSLIIHFFILAGLLVPALTSAATAIPKFAYVANITSNTISVYTINQTTGALTAGTAVATGDLPSSVTVDPSGKFAYVANWGSDSVSVYTINQTTGALTAGTAVATGAQPDSVAVDPSGKFAYVPNANSKTVSVYTINQTTGALTAGTAVATGAFPCSVAIDPSGKFAYVANLLSISVYTINQTTGALTAGTAVATGENPNSVTVDPSGKFAYVSNYGSNSVSVYTINQTTGSLTAGTAVATGAYPWSVAIDPSGKFAYVSTSGTVTMFTINQTTGELIVGTALVDGGANSGPIAIDPSGKFAYVGESSFSVYTINQTTGALTAGSAMATGLSSPSVTITGTRTDQTASFGAAPTIAVGGTGIVSATATSGIVVSYSSTTPSICTILGNTVSGITVGTCTIAANQAGSYNYYAAAQVSQSITVGMGSQTVSFGSSPTIVVGGTGTVSATSTSGLTVSFTSTTPSVCSVSGSTVTAITTGTCTIAANQAGNAAYNAASQVTQPITITDSKSSQTVTFGPVPTIAIGGTGTVSATSTSGLTVSFTSTTPGVCSVSGSTISHIYVGTGISVGTCTIAANQAGNANYSAAAQVTQSISLKDDQTLIFGTAPTIFVGGIGTVTAQATTRHVGLGGGVTMGYSFLAVSLSSLTPSTCSISDSTVTGITEGTCTIAANQAGDATYNAATQVTQSITIGKAIQTVTFGTTPTIAMGGTGTVSATATSGLTVGFSSLTPGVCSVSGSTVTGITAGTCTIAANQAGDANYNPATQKTLSFTISKSFTFTGSVVDTSNRPVAGAQVYFVANGQTFSSTTDGAGLFSLKFDPTNIPTTVAYWITQTGFIPFAGNMTISGSSANAGTLIIEAINGNAVVLELIPDVHHLGDGNFSGAINSGFQKANAEGITFTRNFNLTAAQTGAPGATVTLLAKGLQNLNYLLINNNMIGYLDTSPSDGSFGTVSFQVPMNILVSGPNTISINSESNWSGDYDDFEFTNVVMRLTGTVIANPTVTVSTNAGANGSLTPASQTVTVGATTNFTVTPTTGYVASASGCGGSLTGSTYTTGLITSACTVAATFIKTDSTAPTVTGFTMPTTSNSLTVPVSSLTATDDVAVTGYLISESPTSPSATVTSWSATAPTSFTFSSFGNKTLYAWVKDAAGNVSTSKSATVTVVDPAAPTLVLSTLANGAITNNATLNISGTVSDIGSVASLTINNIAVTVTNGTFSSAVTLQAGPNTITTIASNTLNHNATDIRTITLDTTAPVLTVTTPADNSKTAQLLATFTGTIDETSTVTIKVNNGTAQSASISGPTYSASVALASGLNSISIIATDLAGNATSAIRTVIYDDTKPSLTVSNPAQDISTTQSSLAISGTVSDTITSATISITADNQTYSPVVAQDGSFSQNISFLADKTFAVIVTATDQVGNTSTVQRNIIKSTSLTQPTLSDALKVFQSIVGITQLTPAELIRYDVAPLDANGVSIGNKIIDAADVILILRRSIGIGSW